jgi:hypothetical protein
MGNALRLRLLRARALGRLIGADALRMNRGWTRGLRICLGLIGGPRRSGLGSLLTLGGGLRVWLAGHAMARHQGETKGDKRGRDKPSCLHHLN